MLMNIIDKFRNMKTAKGNEDYFSKEELDKLRKVRNNYQRKKRNEKNDTTN